MDSKISDGEVRWDTRRQRPRQVRGEFALPAALGDTEEAAGASVKRFLSDHAADLGLDMTGMDLEQTQALSTPTGDVIRYRQVRDGTPIWGTEVLVRVDDKERIQQINLEHESGTPVVDVVGDAAVVTSRKATAIAKKEIGQFVARGRPSKPEKLYFPTDEGLRLAYRVVVPTKQPVHDWEVIIDARTEAVLSKEDIVFRMPDGQGMVFDPNPVVTANDNTLRDPDAAASCALTASPQATIDAQRVTRTLRDLTLSGGVHKLEGPWAKMRNFAAPNLTPPEEAAANGFVYTSDDADFDWVNVYYHIDTLQRYIQSLGITTAHNKQIEADAHDDSCPNCAFFSPSDGGLHFGDSGNCRPNRASDGHVTYHEYGHAIQADQVPSWGGTNPTTGRQETRAMGEGFGDILACVSFAGHGGGFQRQVFEDWIFSHPNPGGWPTGLRWVDGTKVYPADWVGSVHANGEIWSAALWNIYRTIGGDVAATRVAARDETLKTLILSHHRVASNATMPDGAEAVMDENAALPEYRLRHGVHFIDSFHDRGLLACQLGSDLKVTELWSQQDDVSVRSWEQVEAGQDNWFYARVRNDGTIAARAAVVLFSFKSPFATPVYPADFRNNIISGAVLCDLAPGATTVVKARWPKGEIPPIPAAATKRHGCILAEVYNPCDGVAPGVTSIGASGGKLKQRNTDIVNLLPDATVDYFMDLGSYAIARPELVRLEVIRDPRWQHVEVSFHHPNPKTLERLIKRVEFIERPGRAVARRFPLLRVLDPTRIVLDPRTSGINPEMIFNLAPGSTVRMPSGVGDEPGVDDASDDPNFMRSDVNLESTVREGVLRFPPGHRIGFPYLINPRSRNLVNLKIKAPRDARPGDQFTININQKTRKGELVGEFEIIVNIVGRG